MKTILKLEEAAMTVVAICVLSVYNLGMPVWLWVILFFAPDIGMLGYLFNARAGALLYNVFHHKGIAIVLALGGYLIHSETIIAIGTLLFAHASFDRVWGYGLKFPYSFKETHLGSLN